MFPSIHNNENADLLIHFLHKTVRHKIYSFAFLFHVLIRKLQDLDRMPIKKYSTRNFDFPVTSGPFHDDIMTPIDWAI